MRVERSAVLGRKALNLGTRTYALEAIANWQLSCHVTLVGLNLIGGPTFQTKGQKKNVRSIPDCLSPGGMVRSGYDSMMMVTTIQQQQ